MLRNYHHEFGSYLSLEHSLTSLRKKCNKFERWCFPK